MTEAPNPAPIGDRDSTAGAPAGPTPPPEAPSQPETPAQPESASPPETAETPETPDASEAAEAPKRKTTRERAEERRQEKLDHVREQIESGSLTVRRMTEEELKLNQPRPVNPKPSRGRGR